jgi:hypothetical protein
MKRKYKWLIWGAVLTVLVVALTPRNIRRSPFFSKYYRVSSVEELPSEYRDWIPRQASNIVFRIYRGGHWVTGEYKIEKGRLVDWMKDRSINLEDKDDCTLEVISHRSSASVISFRTINLRHGYSYTSPAGSGVVSAIYDIDNEKLYFHKTRL